MARRNYKFYADLGLHTQLMVRFSTVLEPGAGPNFLVESILSPQVRSRVNTDVIPDISKTNNSLLKTIKTMTLVVSYGQSVVKLDFIVCQSPAVPVIFGCDYCDRFVDGIPPRLSQVKSEDEKYQLIIANEIIAVTPNQPFRILVANLGRQPQRLFKHQIIGSVTPHPSAMLPTRVKGTYVLGIVT